MNKLKNGLAVILLFMIVFIAFQYVTQTLGNNRREQGRRPCLGSLAVDLDGDGVEMVSLADGVHFDHDNNRFAEKSGWLGPDDAFLVWDRNQNGLIDGGGELFGNHTALPTGKKAAGGFASLAALNSNGDKTVDADDADWPNLALWQDKNGNGLLDPGEARNMAEAGIRAFKLKAQDKNTADPNGNRLCRTGSLVRADGEAAELAEVRFKKDFGDSQFLDEVEVSAEIAKLPDMRGSGNVPSLHQAMALDTSSRLKTLVERFVASDPLLAKQMTWDILFAWTDTTHLSPKGRGANIADARKVHALEKFWGRKWRSAYHGANPGPAEGRDFYKRMADWEAKTASFLLLQKQYRSFFRLAVKASQAAKSGTPGREAVADLVAALREKFGGGGEAERASVADILHTLNVYDSRGVHCAAILKSIYSDPYASDEFEKWLALAFKKSLIGTVSGERLRADNADTFIQGLRGNDILAGRDGDDFLDGGLDNDHLRGGEGNDRYFFSPGSGRDRIDNQGGGRDSLQINGVSPEGLWFRQVENNLEIGLAATGDHVTVINWFGLGDFKLDVLEAGDKAITADRLTALLPALLAIGAPAGTDGTWTDEQQKAQDRALVLPGYWQPKEELRGQADIPAEEK